MTVDSEIYALAAEAAEILIDTLDLSGNADGIDRLVDDMVRIGSASPLHPLVIAELHTWAANFGKLGSPH